MTREEHRTVVTGDPARTPSGAVTSAEHHTLEVRPSGGETARRVVVFLFGIIQVLIGLRIALLVIAANPANGLVSWIYNASQLFVGPFEGVLGTNALASGGSVLDLAAIVAFVGWSALELVVLWGINVFRREPSA